ncbi:MAG: DUF5615 family PIN-like protein [Flavobacteriales bacterium]|nr:DUF5615 family PIN-like protein [Flavobacteriales bacterium]
MSSIGIDHPGIRDEEVMTIAIEEKRTILTFDRDYGELIFKKEYKPEQGVIYLRLNKFKADQPGKIIERMVLEQSLDFTRALTVVEITGIRQRKY